LSKKWVKTKHKKSPGIAIISNTNQEMRTYAYFDYLGYRFHEDGLTIPDKTILKIKQKISRLVNLYLIYYLGFGFNPEYQNRMVMTGIS
jgi:hypothetical protein